MKLLSYHSTRNLSNNEDAFGYLIDTLRESIFTWDYFVDFNKGILNVNQIESELQTLNRLLGLSEEEIDNIFTNIVSDFPKVRKVFPILIATRMDKFKDTPIIQNIKTMEAINKKHIFDPRTPLNQAIINDLIEFFYQSGLRKFFINKEVSNLIDYCKGIEVGMDTNARKNRTGTSMENLVETYISDFCLKYDLKYMSQATKVKLKEIWGIDIQVDKIERRFDFAIVDNYKNLTLVEVNYYSGGGSKLKATAGEYKEVQTFLSRQNINFVWVTDGKGWLTAKTALQETFELNNYTINLQMISEGILEEIILPEQIVSL